MGTGITITQRQAPTFRAMIKDSSGTLFDYATNLATAAELAEEGIDAAPASFTIRKSNGGTTPYVVNTDNSSVVEGFEDVEIGEDAFIEAETVESDNLAYNFQVTPVSRATFPFKDVGYYIVDFTLYPKEAESSAIVFRVGVTVK